MNISFTVIDLTRLGFKPEFTAPEADALASRVMIRTSELSKRLLVTWKLIYARVDDMLSCFR